MILVSDCNCYFCVNLCLVMSPGEAGVVSAGYATDEFSFEIKTCPKPVVISVKLTVEQEPSLVCFPEGLYLLVKWDLGIYSGGFYL